MCHWFMCPSVCASIHPSNSSNPKTSDKGSAYQDNVLQTTVTSYTCWPSLSKNLYLAIDLQPSPYVINLLDWNPETLQVSEAYQDNVS